MCRRGFTQKLLSTRLSEAWNGKKDRAGSSFNFYGMPFLSMWAFLFKRVFFKRLCPRFYFNKRKKNIFNTYIFYKIVLNFFLLFPSLSFSSQEKRVERKTSFSLLFFISKLEKGWTLSLKSKHLLLGFNQLYLLLQEKRKRKIFFISFFY